MDFEFEQEAVSVRQQSTFVSVLAWIFIVIAGFSTFVGLLQNVMVWTIFQMEPMTEAQSQMEQADDVPAIFNFVFNHFELFFLLTLCVSAFTLISAIGLLKRKNWARVAFIWIMALGIFWNLLSLIIQFYMFSTIPEFSSEQAVPPEFETMMIIMRIATVVMVVALSGLFGFIIKKLCSQQIKVEFGWRELN
ncbi:MAG: hypothetical protein C0622_03585 [Desulfuromonas sp.]|nr:MAG: hypothetical protein C0622_03585 [Desulfuromonas sp.]